MRELCAPCPTKRHTPACWADRSMEDGDLFERLDSMSRAEPLSAEDDLVLRMSAVSKVRSRKGVKEKRKGKCKVEASSPSKGIAKRRQPKRDSMKIDSVPRKAQQTSAAVAAAAVAAVQEAAASARSRTRSNSI